MKLLTEFKSIWKSNEIRNKKATKALGIFLVFLFIGSMVSRGVYAALLPRVETENPTYRNLVHKITVYGELSAKREVAVYGEPGLRIDRIFVKEGEKVEEGDALLQYDLQDLEKILAGMKTDAEKLNIQIETVTYNNALLAQAKDRERQRAGEDLLKTEQRSLEDAAAAAEKVNKARGALGEYPDKDTYIKEMYEKDAKYRELTAKIGQLEKQIEKIQSEDERPAIQMDITVQGADAGSSSQDIGSLKSELSAAKKELKAYKKTLKEGLGTQWEEQRQALEDALKEQEHAAASVDRQNEDSLQSAARSMEDALLGSAKDSSPELLKLDLHSLEEEIALYEKVRAQNGILTSQYAGIVTKLLVSESDRIPDGAVCRIADAAEGYYFEGEISKKDRELVTVQDKADLILGNGNGTTHAKIVSIKETADEESYLVTFESDEAANGAGNGGNIADVGNIGDIGRAEIEKQEEKSCISVPISAIREERGTKYVLVTEERPSILGTVQVAVRRNVEVFSLNESYAALSGSGVSKEDNVIINATKPVAQGNKLRLLNP